MNQQQLVERVQKVACELLRVPAERVQADSRLREDLEADSLFLTQFLLGLEDEFAIETDDGDMEGILTLNDAARYIAGKLGVNQG